MPYKNIEERRACRKRWYWKNRYKELKRNRKHYAKHKREYSIIHKKWRENNLEKAKQIAKNWRDSHKEHSQRYQQAYYKTHKNKIIQRNKEYCKNNKEKVRKIRYNSYLKNKEKITIKHKKWRNDHIEELKIYRERYQKSKKGEEADLRYRKSKNGIINEWKKYSRRRQVKHSFTYHDWQNKLKQYKGICPDCKKKKSLTMHHSPAISKAPLGFIYTIDDVTPLCLSCNDKRGTK